ncbi:gamma-mobile-trio protein GmtX [Pandoraea sp. E26]|uniref:gamma-mobile-trio protein GmtX n=1 Tax=Pandoraea sp. E26 TaxID=1427365 RepID=UPI00048DC7EC|nr:gamma-mobile-trio protein GmtX [Pandoraea sp. E26]
MTEQLPATAPDILKDARRLYQVHRNAATKPSKVENLDKVWEVLNAIRHEGGRDYSLAEVGRRLEKMSGPKTQSLRNTQGAHYREIITAYANAVSGATRYVAKTKSNVEQALDLIIDPSIRATIRFALDEAKRLKVVNDNLHAAFKALQVGASLESRVAAEAVPSLRAPAAAGSTLSPRLVNALRKGIDRSRLAQQGLHVGEDGSIENVHGDKFFPPAFVTAIQTILGRA